MKRWLNSYQTQLYTSIIAVIVLLLILANNTVNTAANIRQIQSSLEYANRQQVNAYLLVSLVRRVDFTANPTERASTIQALRDTIALSQQIEAGLRNGDSSLNLPPITNANLLVSLDDSDRVWAEYIDEINTYLDEVIVADNVFHEDTDHIQEHLDNIDRQSVLVYTFTDAVVRGLTFQSEQQVQSNINTLIGLLGMIGVALLISAGLVIRSVRALNQLSKMAQLVAAGDLKARAHTRTVTEVSDVAQVFNQMISRVSTLITSLEESAQEARGAQERAERSDKVKSAFLASMSHELRTPLNAVINFTRFVIDGDVGPVNDQQKELLTDVTNSGKHLLSLINDVLDMSKIEAGSLALYMEDNVKLETILEQVVSTGRGLLGDKAVTLETSIASDLPSIRGDRQRLTQIYLNILSNACKFTDEGLIRITAEVIDHELIVAVQDSGPGIAAEDIDLVFQPFKQTKAGIRKGGGTGLGMPITKNLIEAHGGRIWVESEVGTGSIFYTALPLVQNKIDLPKAELQLIPA
jgi:signal transduction histidine kinase